MLDLLDDTKSVIDTGTEIEIEIVDIENTMAGIIHAMNEMAEIEIDFSEMVVDMGIVIETRGLEERRKSGERKGKRLRMRRKHVNVTGS